MLYFTFACDKQYYSTVPFSLCLVLLHQLWSTAKYMISTLISGYLLDFTANLISGSVKKSDVRLEQKSLAAMRSFSTYLCLRLRAQ